MEKRYLKYDLKWGDCLILTNQTPQKNATAFLMWIPVVGFVATVILLGQGISEFNDFLNQNNGPTANELHNPISRFGHRLFTAFVPVLVALVFSVIGMSTIRIKRKKTSGSLNGVQSKGPTRNKSANL